jgi:cytochrome c oxidase subunit 2
MPIVQIVIAVVAATVTAASSPAPQDADVREFAVTVKRFEFVPATIEVTQGDRVRLVVSSADTEHGIDIKAYGIKQDSERKGGKPLVIEFVADKAGSFPIACSEYCGSGHRSMKGTLVVRAASESR